MAIIYPEGTQQKFIKVEKFEYGTIGQVPATTNTNYTWWSVNFNRQNSGSSLMIWSVIPVYELPNGPYVGCALNVNGYISSKGLLHFRPNNDTTAIGHTCIVTSSDIGSTTGNITIAHLWNWHHHNSSVKPFNRTNLSGGSGSTPAGNYDPRVGTSARTYGSMIVQEYIP